MIDDHEGMSVSEV